MHGEAIRNHVRNMCRLDEATVQCFHQVVRFQIGVHHVNMQPHQDPQRQCLSMQFMITEEEVKEIVDEWTNEWRILVLEDQLIQE